MRLSKHVISAAALSLGCYTYVPVEIDQAPLQSEVRAVLSTAGEINLRERVGILGGRLEGELVERTADQLMIAVQTAGAFTSSTGEKLVQRVDIPRADVLLVEVREPSTPKTVGLLAGAVGVVTTLAIVTFNADRNPGGGNLPPGDPDERIGVRLLPFLLRIP